MEQQSYLKILESTLDNHRELLTLLNRKKELINQVFEVKFLDERESMIAEIKDIDLKIEYQKLLPEIYSLERIIQEKENYFKEYSKEFDLKKLEVDKNYFQLLNKAKNRAPNDVKLKQFLETVNFKMIESDPEMKVNFYYKLKTMLNQA